MSEKTSDVDLQSSFLGEAERVFNSGRAKLFGADGERLFSEAEHGRRMQDLLQPLRAQTEKATAAADADIEAVARELMVVDGADLFAELSPEAQQQAAAQREFVREDIERLPLSEIGARARAVALGDDQAAQYLFWRYGRQRLERVKDAVHAGTLHLQPNDALGLNQLDEAVPALEKRLGGRIEQQRQALEKRREAAVDLKVRASRTLMGAGVTPAGVRVASVRDIW